MLCFVDTEHLDFNSVAELFWCCLRLWLHAENCCTYVYFHVMFSSELSAYGLQLRSVFIAVRNAGVYCDYFNIE